MKKVEALVREGEVSRAAKLLSSSGLAPDTDDTLRRLQEKHPAMFKTLDSQEVENTDVISLNHDIILKALKSLPRGSAPGPLIKIRTVNNPPSILQ